MSTAPCKHAASGCDYPASECSGACSTKAAPVNPPAFPVDRFCNDPVASFSDLKAGMSLRDYFIAHAPHEPQPWFEPVMDGPCPQSPRIEDAPEHLRPEVRAELMEDYGVRVGHEAIEWIRQRRSAVYAWTREQEKRRYTQWPAAWADEQLAAREKQS